MLRNRLAGARRVRLLFFPGTVWIPACSPPALFAGAPWLWPLALPLLLASHGRRDRAAGRLPAPQASSGSSREAC